MISSLISVDLRVRESDLKKKEKRTSAGERENSEKKERENVELNIERRQKMLNKKLLF